MRHLIVFVIFIAVSAGVTSAQTSAQEKAASLLLQLAEVETKQAELQTRLKALDEDIKPENIEKSLAGVGSTKPEDLREQRRKQLEIERNGVQAQLNLLATSHARLETSIAQADAEAYRQSAAPQTNTTSGSVTETSDQKIAPAKRPRRSRKKKARRSRRAHHAVTSKELGKPTFPTLRSIALSSNN